MVGKSRKITKFAAIIGLIITCSFLAIVAHAILPAKVDESRLDGILVTTLSFPVVATIYFIILYTQCALSIMFSIEGSPRGGSVAGFYLGLAYALLYIVGMQELVIDVSPFEEWSVDFVVYQFYMGLGDAIPVIILCSAIGRIVKRRPNGDMHEKRVSRYSPLLFAIVIGTERTLISLAGLIHNTINVYPLQVILWNYALGCTIGICYMILRKHYSNNEKLMIFGISFNWIIFNMFIGLIKKGAMFDSLLRSVIDALMIVLVMQVLRIQGRKYSLS